MLTFATSLSNISASLTTKWLNLEMYHWVMKALPQVPALLNPLHTAMYVQWYASAANNPFHADYSTILNRFPPNNNIDPQVLLEQVLGNLNIPQAFLMISRMLRGAL